MKKDLKFLLGTFLISLIISFTACSLNSDDESNNVDYGDGSGIRYSIRVYTNNDKYDNYYVYSGAKLKISETPVISENQVFIGWSTSDNEYLPYNFDLPVYSDFYLYAIYDACLYRIDNYYNSAFQTKNGYVCFETTDYSPFTLSNKSLHGIEVYIQKENGEKTKVESAYVNSIVSTSNEQNTPDVFLYSFTPITELGNYTIYVTNGFGNEVSTTLNVSTIPYTVTFETNGGSLIPSVVVSGESSDNYFINLLSSDYFPTKTNYFFSGWYTDTELTTPVVLDSNGKLNVTENCTLYAKWIPGYTVTFDENYRSSYSSTKKNVTLPQNDKVNRPMDPSLSSHTFVGWSTSKDSYIPYDFNTPVTSDITLYALFSPMINKVVSYHNFHELDTTNSSVCFYTTNNPFTFTDNILYGLEVYIRKDGETENTQVSCTSLKSSVIYNYAYEYDFAPIITQFGKYYITVKCGSSEDTYEFNYTYPIYKVVFESNGGTKLYSELFNGTNDYSLALSSNSYIPTKEGVVFAGWYIDSELTIPVTLDSDGKYQVTANTTLYAKWGESRTVIFDEDYRSTTSSTKKRAMVGNGGLILKPTNPYLSDHTFIGWSTSKDSYVPYDFNTPVTSDMTLYAVYAPIIYTISALEYELSTTNSSVYFKVNTSSIFKLIDGKINGIEVYVEKTGGEKTRVNITYSKVSSSSNYIYEYGFEPLTEFGIYTIFVKYGNSEKSYTLHYNYPFYRVSFETNGGSIIKQKLLGGSNSNYVLDFSNNTYKPTKNGYVFMGWYTDSAFTNPVTLDADGKYTVTANCILYAKWAIGRTVTFNKNYKSSASNVKTSVGVELGNTVAEPTQPELAFHYFMGWSTSVYIYRPYDFNTPVNEDITLYAIYMPIIYSVHSSLSSCTTSNGSVCFETTSANPFTFTDGSLYGIEVYVQKSGGERTSVSSTYSKTSSSSKDVFEYTFTPVTEPGTYTIYVKSGNSEKSLTNAFTVE